MSDDTSDGQAFDLEIHLKNMVTAYCEHMSAEDTKILLDRISCDEGNKKYTTIHGFDTERSKHKVDSNGKKIYEIATLTDFPNSETDFSDCFPYPVDSQEHKQITDKIKKLINKFTDNNSAVAKDLNQLLNNSNINFMVFKKWDVPNGNCYFKKAENDNKKNEILICICDLNKTGDEVLVGILAHELAHALDFSKRPAQYASQYMDGNETAADITGTILAVNAGLDPRSFGNYMGNDYETNKEKYQKKPMLYTPDGYFRKQNFDIAYETLKRAIQQKTKNNKKISDKKLYNNSEEFL